MREQDLLLSFVMPIYNTEKYLKNCIESLLLLDSQDVEFVLIDDGSTDSGLQICNQFAQRDARLKIYHQENGGVSAARNAGLKQIRGKYVCFIDSDDRFIADTAKVFLNMTHDSDLYCFDYCTEYRGTLYRQKRQLPKEGMNRIGHLFELLLSGHSNIVCNNIYKTDIIKQNAISFPFDVKMGEDILFNVDYFLACQNCYYCEKALFVYVIDRPDSAMNNQWIDYVQDYVRIYDKLKDYYAESRYADLFDKTYYLESIFKCLVLADYHIDNKIIKIFENSQLYSSLMKERYVGRKLRFKRTFLHYKLYRMNFIKQIIIKLVYQK